MNLYFPMPPFFVLETSLERQTQSGRTNPHQRGRTS